MTHKIKTLFATALLGAVFVFSATGADAQTSTVFLLDNEFDGANRTQITATLRIEGEKAQFYVEDAYWDSLSASNRASILSILDSLENSFSNKVYPNITRVYGQEYSPGIDNNEKITVLFTNMSDGIGGYFREEDEFKKAIFPTSNEREMFYINTDFLGNQRQAEAFLAHEFQHLVNFNQRRRLRNVREEVWVNEMFSEVAPSIAGLNNSYAGSNLKSRVDNFVNNSSDSLVDWNNASNDYSSISVFGHYILDHYGEEFFTKYMASGSGGIAGINETLSALGKSERFSDIFNNWAVSVLVNDCTIVPVNKFCYLNQNLSYNNLHIEFGAGTEGGDSISLQRATLPWEGEWQSFSRDIEAARPDNHVGVFEFTKAFGSTFEVPYVVYEQGKKPQIYYLQLEGTKGKFYVEDFGYNVDQVVMLLLNHGTNADVRSTFTLDVNLSSTIPSGSTDSLAASEASADIPEGALVRAEGDTKVYIIKGKYKRWVQTAEIFNMYGHLRWEDIITVKKAVLDAYTESTLVREMDDGKVWFVSLNGQKRWIQTEQEFLGLGYSFDMVYEINKKELDYYPEI